MKKLTIADFEDGSTLTIEMVIWVLINGTGR